jgi:formate dehydrogenase subunit delta
MDIQRLVKMANDIGDFFAAEPDRAVAMQGVAGHIRRFWEPRMRREILRWIDEREGEGLSDLVLAAIRDNHEMLRPPA